MSVNPQKGRFDNEDSSTLSSSRAEEWEATIDRVTMEKTALLQEKEN
jgi:hypothetical protein